MKSLTVLRPQPLVGLRRRSSCRRPVIEALEGRTLLSVSSTTTTVSAASRQLFFQQTETLTASVRVSALGAVPSDGTVTFFDGSTPLGSAPVSNGAAALTTTALGAGAHTITAWYSGSADFGASQSGTVQSVLPSAGLDHPYAVAVDAAGDVFIADSGNGRVVKLTPTGTQTVVAYGLNDPSGVAVDSSGDVVIADTGDNRVLEVTPSGNETTIGTGLVEPMGVAVDSSGDVFIADTGNSRVVEVKRSGSQSLVGSGLAFPEAVAVDAAGDVFIADTNNAQVVEVPSGGTQTTFLSGLQSPRGVAVDAAGNVFIAVSNGVGGGLTPNQVLMVSAAKRQTPIGFLLNDPTGVAVDAAGDVFIADAGNNQVFEETPGVPLRIIPAAPSITWASPADITYGTRLGTTQLDATASVPGTFSYNPRPGTILPAGTAQLLSVTFTPTDSTDYATTTATVPINVDQAIPTLNWNMPGDITVGTPLSATQLDATSNVPGTFNYTPTAGFMLSKGQAQVLSVTFTPTDTTDYARTTLTTTINVEMPSPAPVIVGAIAIFQRKLTHGRPTGAAMITGFEIDFSTKLNPVSAALASNYEIDVLNIKNVKKRKVASLQPLTNFTVSYDDATASVEVLFTGQPKFSNGGHITVLGGPSSGVTDPSGAFLAGNRVLTIAPGGMTIFPA